VTFDQAANTTLGRKASPEMNAEEAASHHQYALEQYDKAIKRTREDLLRGNQSLRTALITSIVKVCFETLHGNHDSATT
jgi:hypothetical protein